MIRLQIRIVMVNKEYQGRTFPTYFGIYQGLRNDRRSTVNVALTNDAKKKFARMISDDRHYVDAIVMVAAADKDEDYTAWLSYRTKKDPKTGKRVRVKDRHGQDIPELVVTDFDQSDEPYDGWASKPRQQPDAEEILSGEETPFGI